LTYKNIIEQSVRDRVNGVTCVDLVRDIRAVLLTRYVFYVDSIFFAVVMSLGDR